jgi:hypothetical protein
VKEAEEDKKKIDEEVAVVEKEVEEAEEIEKAETGSSGGDDYATVKECETAFALGDKTFIDLGVTKSRWGWQVGPLTKGTHEADIYAGAGKNEISKGTKVGKLTVVVKDKEVVVTYDLGADNTLKETHLYVGDKDVKDIAPGKLGQQHSLDKATSDTYTVKVGGPVNVVAHAVVCGKK